MNHAALTLHLSISQATLLVGYCAAYRAHAWRALSPTTERNQTMRAVQAVQGCLSQARAEGIEMVLLAVSEEKKQALRQMVSVLMRIHGMEESSEERNQILGELAGLRMQLERRCRQTQAL